MSRALSTQPLVPTIPPLPTPGLAPQQVSQLLEARDRGAALRRACFVATFDAWMIAIFAALTGLTGLFSLPSLILAMGMGWVAWREFQGARQLRCLHPRAARMLAINQVCLAAMLIVYALWQGYRGMIADPVSAAAGADPQLTQMLAPIDQLGKLITLSVYAGLVFVAIFVQGGTALYYFTRESRLAAYLVQTPNWITELQRSGVAI